MSTAERLRLITPITFFSECPVTEQTINACDIYFFAGIEPTTSRLNGKRANHLALTYCCTHSDTVEEF